MKITIFSSALIISLFFVMQDHLEAQCSITFSDIQISSFQNQCGMFDLRGSVQFSGGAFGSCGNYFFSGPSDGDAPTVSVPPTKADQDARVFPNPFTSELYIVNLTSQRDVKISVFNMLGVLIFERKLLPDASEIAINLGHLNPGSYLLHVIDIQDYQSKFNQIIIKL